MIVKWYCCLRYYDYILKLFYGMTCKRRYLIEVAKIKAGFKETEAVYTEAVYTEMLEGVIAKFTALGFNTDPTVVITDFERAATSAVEFVIGGHIHKQGCFFHLTQCTWCKIQELGLVRLYREDADVRHFCGMLDGLVFLPLAEVPASMTHLRNVAPVELADLVDYFDATYVTGRYRVVQLPAAHAGGMAPPQRLRNQPPAFPPLLSSGTSTRRPSRERPGLTTCARRGTAPSRS